MVRWRAYCLPHPKLHEDSQRYANRADIDTRRHERNYRHQHRCYSKATRPTYSEEVC